MPNLTITTPGTHTLAADITSTEMIAISIECDNVVLDLNGKTVQTSTPTPSTAVTFGIMASGRSNVTIKNGSVRGAMFGIHAGYSNHITLDNVNCSFNTYIGANLAGGPGNVVRNCTFSNIAGYTAEAYAIGLNGIGTNGVIEHCTFNEIYKQPGTTAVGEGVGILIEANAANVTITDCQFTNTLVRPNTIGVWIATGSTALIEDITTSNCKWGVQGTSASVQNSDFSLAAALTGSVGLSLNSGSSTNNTFSGYELNLTPGVTTGGSATPPPLPSGLIVINGDSNTAPYYVSGPANWTSLLNVPVQNLAVEGKYSDGIILDFPAMLAAPATQYVVMIGTNDMAAAIQNGATAEAALASYIGKMRNIIVTLGAKAPVTIVSPLFSLHAREAVRFPAWVDALAALCAEKNATFVDLWSHMKALSATQTAAQFATYYLVPGVDIYHLSPVGHALVANLVKKVI